MEKNLERAAKLRVVCNFCNKNLVMIYKAHTKYYAGGDGLLKLLTTFRDLISFYLAVFSRRECCRLRSKADWEKLECRVVSCSTFAERDFN